jgi:hypothetical protein
VFRERLKNKSPRIILEPKGEKIKAGGSNNVRTFMEEWRLLGCYAVWLL